MSTFSHFLTKNHAQLTFLVDKKEAFVDDRIKNPNKHTKKAYLAIIMKKPRTLFAAIVLICSLSCASYFYLQLRTDSSVACEQGVAISKKAASDLKTTTVVVSRAIGAIQRILTR